MKDEKNHHGTVNESSTVSYIRHDYHCCVKICGHIPSASGSYGPVTAGRPADSQDDEILVDHIVKIITEFNEGTVLINPFQLVFLGKVYCKICFGGDYFLGTVPLCANP